MIIPWASERPGNGRPQIGTGRIPSRAHVDAYTVSPNEGMDRLGIRYVYRF